MNFFCFVIIFTALHSHCHWSHVNAYPEQGNFKLSLNKDKMFVGVHKSLQKDAELSMYVECKSKSTKKIKLNWMLRRSPCAGEYESLDKEKQDLTYQRLKVYYERPAVDQVSLGYERTLVIRPVMSQEYKCSDQGHKTLMPRLNVTRENVLIFSNNETRSGDTNTSDETQNENDGAEGKTEKEGTGDTNPPSGQAGSGNTNTEGGNTNSRRRRLADGPAGETGGSESTPGQPAGKSSAKATKPAVKTTTVKPAASTPAKTPSDKQHYLQFVDVTEKGIYLLVVTVESPAVEGMEGVDISLELTMKGPKGFLSAIDWPLLPFYATMCALYVCMGLAWFVMSACYWRDLLRVQYWIFVVIFLGMVEKAVFTAEYEQLNKEGNSVSGAVVFAELVSSLKRALARMLVVIVSLGFGIIKPRLGPALHKVLAMGALYFILGSIEGCMRTVQSRSETNSNKDLIAAIPLAVLDALICYWVFSSLVQTLRTLRLRRNVVKLSLYRHFTNTLIFCVLASFVFIIWALKQHRLKKCVRDWGEKWLDEAFWHLLFVIILIVIIILWRPSQNNQRYAFSPLLDAADEDDEDEEEEFTKSGAYEGIKSRSKSPSRRSSSRGRSVDDDLKWVEENIPTAGADSILPSLLDSDEEVMTTKFEMSKME